MATIKKAMKKVAPKKAAMKKAMPMQAPSSMSPMMKKGGKIKKAQGGDKIYSATANKVDSLRAAGAKQIGTPQADITAKRLKAAEAQEKKENASTLAKKKKTLKMGGKVMKAKKMIKAKVKMSKKK